MRSWFLRTSCGRCATCWRGGALARRAALVEIGGAPAVTADPGDDPVFETAVVGRADVLCTLDRHLRDPNVLSAGREAASRSFPIPICFPACAAEERKGPPLPVAYTWGYLAMSSTLSPYGESLALLTDLYELTMAYGYWKSEMAEREAVFHLYFRKHPFQGGFTVASGLGPAVAYLRGFRFEESDLDYLKGIPGGDGKPLLEQGFLDYLAEMEFRCDVDAVAEGTIVFPQEPLVRVRGPLLQCQILETALLNIVNFQTLIATKAARVCAAAQGEPVLDFGMRRAQGIDGAISASRAAYVGGCAATSNVLAGKIYDIPVKGTHAHSWIMSFEDEEESFEAWARAMPNNCIFLVDTYDTIEGVRRAIRVGRRLRERGHEMIGVRLDSGDLVELRLEARKMLDEAGFPDAAIVGSGDLDEHLIADVKRRGAKIGMWGVGTKLVTAYDDPALGGVYKLGAIRDERGEWSDRLKLSDDVDKISNPGVQQVRRFSSGGRFVGDVIYDDRQEIAKIPEAYALSGDEGRLELPDDAESEELLEPVFRDGVCLHEPPTLVEVRERAAEQRERMDDSVLALEADGGYPVGLEAGLRETKRRLASKYGVSAAEL